MPHHLRILTTVKVLHKRASISFPTVEPNKPKKQNGSETIWLVPRSDWSRRPAPRRRLGTGPFGESPLITKGLKKGRNEVVFGGEIDSLLLSLFPFFVIILPYYQEWHLWKMSLFLYGTSWGGQFWYDTEGTNLRVNFMK